MVRESSTYTKTCRTARQLDHGSDETTCIKILRGSVDCQPPSIVAVRRNQWLEHACRLHERSWKHGFHLFQKRSAASCYCQPLLSPAKQKILPDSAHPGISRTCLCSLSAPVEVGVVDCHSAHLCSASERCEQRETCFSHVCGVL